VGEMLISFQSCFKNQPVPHLLKELILFSESFSGLFSGSFELQPDRFELCKAYFQGQKEGVEQVVPFGMDSAGSLFAFWLYDKALTLENAPVVFLSSEGEGSTVLAKDFKDFLILLAANRDFVPEEGSFYCFEEQNRANNSRYRVWLKTHLGLDAAAEPEEFLKKARETHPDF